MHNISLIVSLNVLKQAFSMSFIYAGSMTLDKSFMLTL